MRSVMIQTKIILLQRWDNDGDDDDGEVFCLVLGDGSKTWLDTKATGRNTVIRTDLLEVAESGILDSSPCRTNIVFLMI